MDIFCLVMKAFGKEASLAQSVERGANNAKKGAEEDNIEITSLKRNSEVLFDEEEDEAIIKSKLLLIDYEEKIAKKQRAGDLENRPHRDNKMTNDIKQVKPKREFNHAKGELHPKRDFKGNFY